MHDLSFYLDFWFADVACSANKHSLLNIESRSERQYIDMIGSIDNIGQFVM
jgi:hypothetical protein